MRETEQDLAHHLLAHRERGYSIAYVLKKSRLRYSIQVGLLLLFAVGFFAIGDLLHKGLCLWAIGIFFGAFARDLGWLLRIREQWPFTQKIIKWQDVENIAEGRASAS